MSKQVDERVVSMQFDNRQFESNVKTSMSTLEKLKQSLNFKDSAKGLESINSSAKNINLSGLSAGVETVRAKFSALQVMGVTALSNITNTAVNAGKRMISALTIDPIKTGFSEYETKINSIQTIMSNTASKGTTMKDVTRVIDDLNTYADKTIYNFAEMTRNIGTFTAAGVGLKKSASAIKGIANLAAASGSNSQQASTAMYQLSQALAAGTVKLQDWNSVVNAGMGGEKFQEALKATAREHGVAIDKIIKKQGSFRESLKTGWMTADILNETLNKFTVDGAKKYAKSMMESGKWTKEQADALVKEAQNMEDAATKVKTFTQLWDTLKEAAQSGWGKTWELIIGDFNQAKNLFTKLSDFFGGIIDKMSDTRNKILESALGKGFTKLSKRMNAIIGPAKKATKMVSNLGDIVDKVIVGKFGNGKERFDALSKAGQNYYRVQNKVNETLGNGYRYTDKQIKAQDKLLGIQNEDSKGTVKLTKEKKDLLKKLASMTEEQMRSEGYNDKQIKAFKELGATADKLGMPLDKFIDKMDKINGRWLLLNGFKNIGKSIMSVFKTIGKAWKDVFPPKSIKERSQHLFDLIAAFHKFSTSLKMNTDTAGKLRRTFEGLFAILDLISTITGGAFKIAFKAVTTILGMFDLSLLDVTAMIGDAAVGFRDWTKSILDFTKLFKKIGPYLQSACDGIRDWVSGLKEADNIPEYIIMGLLNGLKNGVVLLWKGAVELGKSLLEGIKNILGIHSPSRAFFEVGENIIAGLVNGIQNGASIVWNAIKNLGSKAIEAIKNIDWNAVFAGLISLGMVASIKKIADAIDSLVSPLRGLGDVLSGAGKVLDESAKGIGKSFIGLSKVLKSFAFSIKAKAIKNIAISIAILVGCVIALTFIETDKLWDAVAILSALIGVFTLMIGVVEGLSILSSKFGSGAINFGALSASILGIGAAMILMAITLKIIGSMNPDQYNQAIEGMVGVIASLIALVAAYGLLVNGDTTKNADELGKMLKKIAVAMLIMAVVMKILGGMKPGALIQGFATLAGFVGIIALLTLITKLAGDSFDKLGNTLIKMSVAMVLMAAVVGILGKMDPATLKQGLAAVGIFVLIIGVLTVISVLGSNSFGNLGKTLMAMAASMLIMSLVVRLLGSMDPGEMVKGYAGILVFVGVIALLTLVIKMLGNDAPKMAATLLAMSASIAILAGVAILLGLIDLAGLAKGVGAIAILGSIMALMIYATKDASDCKGNLIVMTVAIAVMAAAVAALSMIDPTQLAGATLAMSIVMGMFALIAKSASNMNGALGPLIVMTIAVGLIGGLIYILSGLPIQSVLASAASLSIVLLAMSAAMFIASKAGPNALSAVVGLLAMGIVVIELGFVLGLMSVLDTQSAITNSIALSILLGAMTVVLLMLQAVGPSALIGVVALGILTLVVGGLALILGLMSKFDVKPSVKTALALSILLGSMSASLLILGVVGAMGPAAFIGIAALASMIVGLGALIVGIGALVKKFPELETFLNTGIPILEKIGHAIGSFFGNIVSGFIDGVTSSLPKLGETLSQFMINLTPFITGAKTIDSSVMDSIKSLAAAILILTAADVLNGMTSWLTGGSSISSFASELVPLGTGLKQFSDSVAGINPTNITAAANVAKALAQMADTIPNSGGVTAWFAGENSITAFANELPKLGKGLLMFSLSVMGIDAKNIKSAAKAGKSLAEMCSTIPNSGGAAAWFAGDNSISKFGNELPKLGKGLKEFSNAVKGLNTESISVAVKAAEKITEMTGSIPNSGGVVAWFAGDNSISKFGNELPKLGEGLKGFSNAVKGLNAENVTAATGAAKSLAEMASVIPNSGGVVSWFSGDNSITAFADELPKLGEGLNGFSDSLAGISAGNITAAANAAKALAEMTKNTPEDPSKIVKFGEQLSTFGGQLNAYFNKVSGISGKSISASSKAVVAVSNTAKNADFTKLSQASKVIDSLVKSLKGVSSISIKSTIGFTTSLKRIGDTGVDNLLNAFKNASSDMEKAGEDMLDKVISGAERKSKTAKKAFSDIVSDLSNSISDNSDDFKDAGRDVVEGFANGISKNTWRAEAKAAAMAEAAKKAAKKSLKINSPSKEFYKIGDFAGLGFVNALGTYEKKSYKVSTDVAKSAKRGLSKTMSNLASVVDMDIDSQPTIRPVLDLSDVSNGVGAMGRMFDMQPSVGVMSDIQSINSTMSKRQNGNAELLSAVEGLRSDLAASGNGITVEVNLDYNASADANDIANDIATSLRRAIRRGV